MSVIRSDGVSPTVTFCAITFSLQKVNRPKINKNVSKQIRNCKINATGEIFTYRANGIWKDLSLTPYSSETKL